jgi:hypothetical protein
VCKKHKIRLLLLLPWPITPKSPKKKKLE